MLHKYYKSLEARLGYRLLLGGTRHFGYYDADTYWPFPIFKALRAMENELFNLLELKRGAEVLDAGCGVGHVAIHFARKGFRVHCIDVVDHHIQKAQKNIKKEGLQDAISVCKMDYHSLVSIQDESFDGVYTIETLVHATDPKKALLEFYRVLKPGGSIALHEYAYDVNTAPRDLQNALQIVKEYGSMPTEISDIEEMLSDVGFEDITVKDLSTNIRPMLRLLYTIAYMPYKLIRLFRLQPKFVSTVAGILGYQARDMWRYAAVSAKKPLT